MPKKPKYFQFKFISDFFLNYIEEKSFLGFFWWSQLW